MQQETRSQNIACLACRVIPNKLHSNHFSFRNLLLSLRWFLCFHSRFSRKAVSKEQEGNNGDYQSNSDSRIDSNIFALAKGKPTGCYDEQIRFTDYRKELYLHS